MRNVWLILLAIFLLILMLVWSNPAKAHEDKVWRDSKGYNAYGSKKCGMGYRLAGTGEGTWQPYLYAGSHWHGTPFVMATPSCALMFQAIESYRKEKMTNETR